MLNTFMTIEMFRLNSQPRNIVFDPAQEVKVGRSITRTKIADNNAVFDCKVLSRNHAVIWYSCGKFFLRVCSFKYQKFTVLVNSLNKKKHFVHRTLVAVMVHSSIINALVQIQHHPSHTRYELTMLFNSVSMLWKTIKKKRTDAL